MLGYFYVKSEGRGKIANKLMLRWIKTSDEPPVAGRRRGADGAARDGGAAAANCERAEWERCGLNAQTNGKEGRKENFFAPLFI